MSEAARRIRRVRPAIAAFFFTTAESARCAPWQARPLHTHRNLTHYEQSKSRRALYSLAMSGFERMSVKALRPTVLFMVLALHLAALALLLAHSRTPNIVGPAEHAIQLVVLAPVKPPKVRIENARPQHWSTNIAPALAPPALNSSNQSGPGSAPDGRGPAVNWAAEAHRAVRAFEIRRHQTGNSALSVSSSLDESGSREHHAGDQMKTASGDWIVWINADCYQIAAWHSETPAVGTISPKTICRNPAAAPSN
jgi:hypothetical protein